jgi:hypothetical protein
MERMGLIGRQRGALINGYMYMHVFVYIHIKFVEKSFKISDCVKNIEVYI